MASSQESTFLEQVVTAKISGLLSTIGSASIIRDVVSRWWRKKNDQTLASIPRIILSMSISDLLNSFFVHILGPWMVPKEKMGFDEYYNLPESLAKGGTDGTCAVQAFVVNATQITSVLTNATLAFAYWMSICWGKSDRELKKWKWLTLLIILPWISGLAVASVAIVLGSSGFGGIWFCDSFVDEYENGNGSELESDSEKDSSHAWRPVLIASILVLTNLMIIFFMLSLIKFVYSIEKRNDTYLRGGDRDRRRTIQVTKQGIWFVLAYMAAWIPPIIASVSRDALPDEFMVFVACFAPLQGAFNAFVYFRPKFNRQESMLVPRLDIIAQLASSVRRYTQRLSITLPRDQDIEQTEGNKSQTIRTKNNKDDDFGENV